MADKLTAHQQKVADNFLDQEETKRSHLVVHLSGAHAYGFASVDSDLDLKAIHIADTKELLGLSTPRGSWDYLNIIDGIEVDYTSNELKIAISGLLTGNGNMLERVLSGDPMRRSPELDQLAALATKNLSKRYYNHYRGFAHSQRKAVEAAEQPQAKKVLYVLRTVLTGVHLLETGQCNPDLTALCDNYGFTISHQLIEQKRSGEKIPLPDTLAQQVPELLETAFDRLDRALEQSQLPAEPEQTEALESWLLNIRRERFAD